MNGFDVNDMTLEQKIGQMLMVGFHSKQFDDHLADVMRRCSIGNFILFSRNIGSVEQTIMLNKDIRERTMDILGIPPFIATDHEGGMVTRIAEGATLLPGNMAVAATDDPHNAYMIGMVAGKELKSMGINMNFAPVLDVNNNPLNPVIGTRSYGENPAKVAEFGVNYINAIQEQGIIATAKHFPGHGDTSVDSHLDLPVVPHEMDRLNNIELRPFKSAINAGVKAIMTAHIVFKALEKVNIPATLSYNVITALLKNELAFRGLVITDCMEMNAIASYFGTANAAVMAIKAGADMVLISHTKEKQIEAAKAIKNAVLGGEIPMSRIDESVCKILDAKRRAGLYDWDDNQAKREVIGCSEHLDIASNISLKSITVVKDVQGLIPVKTSNVLVISPPPLFMTEAEDSKMKVIFAEEVANKLGGSYAIVDTNPDDAAIKDLASQAKGMDIVIVGTYNANLNKGQGELVRALYAQNKNIIVVALRNPYDIYEFEDIPTYICAYEYTPLSVSSIINILSGRSEAEGILPVSINID